MGLYSNIVEFAGTGSAHACVPLPAPVRGTLRSLRIKQLTGTPGGGTFDIFDRSDACSGAEEVSYSGDEETELLSPNLHRVIANQSLSAGAFENFALVAPYENQDERDPVAKRRKPNLYLDIIPAQTGNYAVSYTIEHPKFF